MDVGQFPFKRGERPIFNFDQGDEVREWLKNNWVGWWFRKGTKYTQRNKKACSQNVFSVILSHFRQTFFSYKGGAPLWALGALPRGSWPPSYLWALDFQCPSPLIGSTALPQERVSMGILEALWMFTV